MAFFIMACGEEQKASPPPANLIGQPQMEEILRDICKIEARFQRRLSSKGVNHTDMALASYASVFEKHHITEDEFKASYNYYSSQPDQMQALYDSVIVNLTKEQAELKQAETPKK
jgi:hypothetical protein